MQFIRGQTLFSCLWSACRRRRWLENVLIPEQIFGVFLKRKRGSDDGVSGFRRERTRNAKLSACRKDADRMGPEADKRGGRVPMTL